VGGSENSRLVGDKMRMQIWRRTDEVLQILEVASTQAVKSSVRFATIPW